MATASNIQVVNDPNGAAYGFLSLDGQLIQCRWDSQAQRWDDGIPLPEVLGATGLQATYLDKLWANEPGGELAQGQTWDPGIVVLYRRGQGTEAEIHGLFGGWDATGDLQWSQQVQLTTDALNDREFSLVPGENGLFTLVSQKQEVLQNLPERSSQSLGSLVQPDSDLYTTSFRILNTGPVSAPLLQADPLVSGGTTSWTTTLAALEPVSPQPLPAPALLSTPNTSSGLSKAALATRLSSGNPQATPRSSSVGSVSKTWDLKESESSTTSLQTGYLTQINVWGIRIPLAKGDSLERWYSGRLFGGSRVVLTLTGFYGLTNELGVLAFRSQAKPSFAIKLGGQDPLRPRTLSEQLQVLKAATGESVQLRTTNTVKVGASGYVGSTTYYSKIKGDPYFLQARQALSFDASYIRNQTKLSINPETSIPYVGTSTLNIGDSYGFQWLQSVGQPFNPSLVLPINDTGVKVEESIGAAADAVTFLKFAAGVGAGLASLSGSRRQTSLNAGDSGAFRKFQLGENLFNAVVGAGTALVNPIYLASNQADTFQQNPAYRYKRSESFFNVFSAEYDYKWMEAFGIRGSLFDKSTRLLNAAGNGASTNLFLVELALGTFGAWQPLLEIDRFTVKPLQAAGGTSASEPEADAPGAAQRNDQFQAAGASILYAPSQGSSLYWGPADVNQLLGGQQASRLIVHQLFASGANLIATASNQQFGNGGSGLNPGTYTHVRLLGVTPDGEQDMAEATIVVDPSTRSISSLTITKSGTYVYLPPYSTSATSVLLVPDLFSINEAAGGPMVDSGAIAKGLATVPSILLTAADAGSLATLPAAVIQEVQVLDGGAGYPPEAANGALPASDGSPYAYASVQYIVTDANHQEVPGLVSGSPQTATVGLVNGEIVSVKLDRPFYCAIPSDNGAIYNVELQGLDPVRSASLVSTPGSLSYNNFVDEHGFYAQRSEPSRPKASGVYIADGNDDAAPLYAAQRRDSISSRVVFVDSDQGDNTVNYLNSIAWNPANGTWQATNSRAVLPSSYPAAVERQFSLARLPVATKLPAGSPLAGGDLVAWLEVVNRPVPNSGATPEADYQNFYDNYFNNQQIAFSIHLPSGGQWKTDPTAYIRPGNAIIDDLEISIVPGATADSDRVLLSWSETPIAAIKGQGQSPLDAATVLKAAFFDPITLEFLPAQTISWSSDAAVGIGVADLNISSITTLLNGSIQQQPALFWSQNVAVPYEQAVLDNNPSIYLQMQQGEPGVSAANLGSLGTSPAALTSASNTGLAFNVSGALGINSDAAIENIDGTGVLSTGVGSLSTFLPATAASGRNSSAGVARSPYTIEFWARVPETGNPNGAGLFALGQPSVTPAVLPSNWLLTSSFVVDQLTFQQALGRGLIAAIPDGIDADALYGYAWAVVASGANTTALGGSGGSGLYSNAVTLSNLEVGMTLQGVSDFLASYGVLSSDLQSSAGSGLTADQIAVAPVTELQFSTSLQAGVPDSSLSTVAVSTAQAVMNAGLVTTNDASWNDNSGVRTLFENLWSYQQKTGKAKVNFDLAPGASAAATAPPAETAQESYAGYALDFDLIRSTAVSINGQGQLVFDVGQNSSLLSLTDDDTPLAINDGDWHYIVATYLPDYANQGSGQQNQLVPLSTGTASLYVDNNLVARSAVRDVFSPDSEASDALLLTLNSGGAIDELALYQRALTGVDLTPPANAGDDWPVMTGSDALGLLASLGLNVGGLSLAEGVASGAVNLHWKARSVDPLGAAQATFTSTYNPSNGSWSAAQPLDPVAAPAVTQTSGSRTTSLQDAWLLQIDPSDWGSFNPARQRLQSVTVTPVGGEPITLNASEVLIGEQTLLSRQPRATKDDLHYTFLNNTPSVGLLVPRSRVSGSPQLYTYQLNFYDPLTSSTTTFPPAGSGPVQAVVPISGPRLASRDDLASFTTSPLVPRPIVSAAVLEQAPYQLQYIDSGEVIRSQQDPLSTSRGFGLSQVAGRYSSPLIAHQGTRAGWLAISQPFTPTASSNPAGRVWVQYTGLYPETPGRGNPPVDQSPSTWLNALARSNFSPDAPNLPLLQDSRYPSSSGGLLIEADPTAGWGANLGRVMLVADLDGDGCDELILAAPDSSAGGSVYIIKGSWIQQHLNRAPATLNLNNLSQFAGAVTVLTPALAGIPPTGEDNSNAQFGTALAYDGHFLYIGAPTYQAEVESGNSASRVSVGAVYRYDPGASAGTQSLSLFQKGLSGSLTELDPAGTPQTGYWGERLGTALAAVRTPGSGGIPDTVELAIGAPGRMAALGYSAQGSLETILLPADGEITLVNGTSGFTSILGAGDDPASGSSAYMQRLRQLQSDPIAQATTFFDASTTANEVGAVYYSRSRVGEAGSTQQAVFLGAAPWNTGASGFGDSVALADLTNSSNTLVVGADLSGGSGAAYFIDPRKLPDTPLATSSDGMSQYLAHLAAGLTLYGQNASDHFGSGLVSTGDVNADPGNPAYRGYGDILINAYSAQSGMGTSYLVFGSDLLLGDPNDAASGGAYTGTVSAGGIGTVTNNAGSLNLNILTESGGQSQENVGLGSFNAADVDGDGIHDILLAGRGAGNGYLTWGKPYLQDIRTFQLSRLASDQGFLLQDLATQTQGSLRSLGDFNGDGYGDFYSITPGDQFSQVRVELGGSSQAILADYLYNDFVFNVQNGTQVLAAGDLNSDGMADIALFLQSNLSDTSSGAGSTTGLFYGRPSTALPLGSGFGLLSPEALPAPSRDVEYGLSDAAPSFLAVGDVVYAVVKSYDDNSLWFSRSADGGETWASWVDITASQAGISSALAPSLAFFNGRLILAFADSQQGISLASWDPSTSSLAQWSAPVRVAVAGSSSLSPLLLAEGDALSLYWVNQSGAISTSSASSLELQPAGWTPAATLSGDAAGTPFLSATALAGTLLNGAPVLAYGQADSAGTALASIALLRPDSGGVLWEQADTLTPATGIPLNAPGLTTTGTGLALTYTDADQQIVVNQLRLLTNASDQPDRQINPDPQWQSSPLPGVTSSLGSAPVVVNGLLLVGNVASNDAVQLQAVSSSADVPWLDWIDTTVQLGSILSQRAGENNSIGGLQPGSWSSGIGGGTSTPVALARDGNMVYMAVGGADLPPNVDNAIYWNSSSDNGLTWKGWAKLPPGMTTQLAPSIAVYDGTLYLSYLGLSNNQINITRLTNAASNTWQTQYQIAGQSARDATLVSEDSQLAVYFRSNDDSSRILKSYSSTPDSSTDWTDTSVLYFDSFHQTSSGGIAATRFNGQTYLAYQGGTSLNPSAQIYIATASDSVADGPSPVWSLETASAGISPIKQRGVGLTSSNAGLILTYTDSNRPDQVSVQASNADVSSWTALADGTSLASSLAYTPLITADSSRPLMIAGVDANTGINLQSNGLNYQLLNSQQTGSSISALGDLNGDGYADLTITANNVAYAPNQEFQAGDASLVTAVRLLRGGATPATIRSSNDTSASRQTVQIAPLMPGQSASATTPFASLAGEASLRLNGQWNGSTYRLSSTALNAAGTAIPSAAFTARADDPSGLQTLFSGAAATASTTSGPGVNGLTGTPDLQTLGGFGDLNGDGYTDYLAPDGLNDLYLSDPSLAYSVWSIRAAGDVNGNGLDDVILTLTPPESNAQMLQPVLLDGVMFKVVDDQFSLSRAGGSYESGWTSAGLKLALNPSPSPGASDTIPSLQVWFEPIQGYIGYDATEALQTSSSDNLIIPITLHNRSVGASASTVGDDGIAYVAMSNSSPDANGNNNITLSYGQPDSASWTTVAVQNFASNKNSAPVVTSTAIYRNRIYIAYTSNDSNGKPRLNVVSADLSSDLTQAASWTNTNPNSILGSGALVNEGSRLSLYYTAYSAAYNRQPSNSSLYALYSTGFNASGVSWASSGTAVRDASGISLTASSLAAARFRGQTVLAFYSGSYSKSDTTLTFAQPISADPGAAVTTYASSLGFSTGGVPPRISLTANASQLYLNNAFSAVGDCYLATGAAYNAWDKQQNNISNLSGDSSNTSNVFASKGQLYVAYASQSSGKPILHINPTTFPPATAQQVSLAGYSIDGNIDINADGYRDILISDPSNPSQGLANQYALFGGDFLDIANQIGTASDDTLLGTPLADIIVTLDGADAVEGRGGKDVILTGSGDDNISLVDGNFLRVDAGSGFDRLQLQGLANQDWYFGAASISSDSSSIAIRPGNRLKSAELISSLDYGANTISLDRFGVEHLNENHLVFLVPDAQDRIRLSVDFSRNPTVDLVVGGLRWNGFTTSDLGAAVFVLVPSSQTTTNAKGENVWLESHVTSDWQAFPAASVQAAQRASSTAVVDPADAYLPWLRQQAGTRVADTQEFSVTAQAAPEGSAIKYVITRRGVSDTPLAIRYSSTSANGTANPGVDYVPVAGVILLQPGDLSRTLTVSTRSDAVAEGSSEQLSVMFEAFTPTAATREFHVSIQPTSPVLLSDFRFDGAHLQFRGDAAASGNLNFRLIRRSSADQSLDSVPPSSVSLISQQPSQSAAWQVSRVGQVQVDLPLEMLLQEPAAAVTRTPLVPPLQVDGVSIPLAYTGTSQRDRIKGNRLNNLINGLEKRDKLTGGRGSDVFQYDLRSGIGPDKADVITDFRQKQGDRIALSADLIAPSANLRLAVFSGRKGSAVPTELAAGDEALIYNRRSGELYLNRNGTEAGLGSEGGLLATLKGHLLLSSDDLVPLEPISTF